MPLTPLVPAARPGDTDRRWSVAASTVLHLAALAIIVGIAARQPPPSPGSPAFDLVFENPAQPSEQAQPSKPPGLPPIQPANIPPPPDAPLGTPAPPPLSPPQPNGATTPQPEAAQSAPAPESAPPPAPAETARPIPAPAQPPAPEAATPVAPATAPAPPPPLVSAPPEAVVPAIPVPAQVPQPTPPEVNLRARAGQSILRLDTTPIMPKPPAPLPPAPPRPRVLRRQALGTLSSPMNLSLGPAAPRPAARGALASRTIDLSPPPEQDGPSPSDAYAKIRAANASADWNRGLLQYWLRHRFYPQQAAVNGDEGTVTIQLTVDRSGLVRDVEVISPSGSQWLDMAALATFRGAHLPPFTNEMRQKQLTFPIPITYILIRR